MRTRKLIHVVSCHAEGEPGDVIVGGVFPPPGQTILEQSQYIAKDQELRNFVLNEPRGGVFRHVNLLVPAKADGAVTGWIIMEPADTPPMSGSNAMCVAAVLVETGLVPAADPTTTITLEAPGGVVIARVLRAEGCPTEVTITNVPSFVDRLDVAVEVPSLGTLRADIAYGGDSFAVVDASKLGFRLTPDEARELAELGTRITRAVNEQHSFDVARRTSLEAVSFCQFAAPLDREGNTVVGVNAVAIRPGKIDRSPCGTGCSARMAILHARGLLRAHQPFIGKSILGSRFHCHIERESQYKGASSIVPSLRGRAWLTGIHQYTLDPTDPWPGGYRLTDTWPSCG